MNKKWISIVSLIIVMLVALALCGYASASESDTGLPITTNWGEPDKISDDGKKLTYNIDIQRGRPLNLTVYFNDLPDGHWGINLGENDYYIYDYASGINRESSFGYSISGDETYSSVFVSSTGEWTIDEYTYANFFEGSYYFKAGEYTVCFNVNIVPRVSVVLDLNGNGEYDKDIDQRIISIGRGETIWFRAMDTTYKPDEDIIAWMADDDPSALHIYESKISLPENYRDKEYLFFKPVRIPKEYFGLKIAKDQATVDVEPIQKYLEETYGFTGKLKPTMVSVESSTNFVSQFVFDSDSLTASHQIVSSGGEDTTYSCYVSFDNSATATSVYGSDYTKDFGVGIENVPVVASVTFDFNCNNQKKVYAWTEQREDSMYGFELPDVNSANTPFMMEFMGWMNDSKQIVSPNNPYFIYHGVHATYTAQYAYPVRFCFNPIKPEDYKTLYYYDGEATNIDYVVTEVLDIQSEWFASLPAGYRNNFTGWSFTEGHSTPNPALAPGNSFAEIYKNQIFNYPLTLYATFSFDLKLNSGENAASPDMNLVEEEIALTHGSAAYWLPNPPEAAEGYVFDCWMDNAGNRYSVGARVLLEDDTTFTAQWDRVRKINYYYYPGDESKSVSVRHYGENLKYGDTPIREIGSFKGLTSAMQSDFLGWTADKEGWLAVDEYYAADKNYAPNKLDVPFLESEDELNLYAVYKTYTVTLDMNGSSLRDDQGEVLNKKTLQVPSGMAYTLPEEEVRADEYFTFSHWQKGNGYTINREEQYKVGDRVTITADTDFVAFYTKLFHFTDFLVNNTNKKETPVLCGDVFTMPNRSDLGWGAPGLSSHPQYANENFSDKVFFAWMNYYDPNKELYLPGGRVAMPNKTMQVNAVYANRPVLDLNGTTVTVNVENVMDLLDATFTDEAGHGGPTGGSYSFKGENPTANGCVLYKNGEKLDLAGTRNGDVFTFTLEAAPAAGDVFTCEVNYTQYPNEFLYTGDYASDHSSFSIPGTSKTVSYNVSFDNDGNGNIEGAEDRTVSVNAPVTLPTSTAASEGMAFSHWLMEGDEKNTEYFAGQIVPVTADTVFVAQFNVSQWGITIDYGEKSAEEKETESISGAGARYVLPAAPEAADGYAFSWWSDGSQKFDPGYEYAMANDGNVTFTAIYEEVYTVTYHYDPTDPSKTFVDYCTKDNTQQGRYSNNKFAYYDDARFTDQYMAAKDTFKGWATAAMSCDATMKANDSMYLDVVDNIDLYPACYYTVKFSYSTNSAKEQKVYYTNAPEYVLPDFAALGISISNADLYRWVLNGEEYAAGDTVAVSSDVTYSARLKYELRLSDGENEHVDYIVEGMEYTFPTVEEMSEYGFKTEEDGKPFIGWTLGYASNNYYSDIYKPGETVLIGCTEAFQLVPCYSALPTLVSYDRGIINITPAESLVYDDDNIRYELWQIGEDGEEDRKVAESANKDIHYVIDDNDYYVKVIHSFTNYDLPGYVNQYYTTLEVKGAPLEIPPQHVVFLLPADEGMEPTVSNPVRMDYSSATDEYTVMCGSSWNKKTGYYHTGWQLVNADGEPMRDGNDEYIYLAHDHRYNNAYYLEDFYAVTKLTTEEVDALDPDGDYAVYFKPVIVDEITIRYVLSRENTSFVIHEEGVTIESATTEGIILEDYFSYTAQQYRSRDIPGDNKVFSGWYVDNDRKCYFGDSYLLYNSSFDHLTPDGVYMIYPYYEDISDYELYVLMNEATYKPDNAPESNIIYRKSSEKLEIFDYARIWDGKKMGYYSGNTSYTLQDVEADELVVWQSTPTGYINTDVPLVLTLTDGPVIAKTEVEAPFEMDTNELRAGKSIEFRARIDGPEDMQISWMGYNGGEVSVESLDDGTVRMATLKITPTIDMVDSEISGVTVVARSGEYSASYTFDPIKVIQPISAKLRITHPNGSSSIENSIHMNDLEGLDPTNPALYSLQLSEIESLEIFDTTVINENRWVWMIVDVTAKEPTPTPVSGTMLTRETIIETIGADKSGPFMLGAMNMDDDGMSVPDAIFMYYLSVEPYTITYDMGAENIVTEYGYVGDRRQIPAYEDIKGNDAFYGMYPTAEGTDIIGWEVADAEGATTYVRCGETIAPSGNITLKPVYESPEHVFFNTDDGKVTRISVAIDVGENYSFESDGSAIENENNAPQWYRISGNSWEKMEGATDATLPCSDLDTGVYEYAVVDRHSDGILYVGFATLTVGEPAPVESGISVYVNGVERTADETVEVKVGDEVSIQATGYGEAEDYDFDYRLKPSVTDEVRASNVILSPNREGKVFYTFDESGDYTLNVTASKPVDSRAATYDAAEPYTMTINLKVTGDESEKCIITYQFGTESYQESVPIGEAYTLKTFADMQNQLQFHANVQLYRWKYVNGDATEYYTDGQTITPEGDMIIESIVMWKDKLSFVLDQNCGIQYDSNYLVDYDDGKYALGESANLDVSGTIRNDVKTRFKAYEIVNGIPEEIDSYIWHGGSYSAINLYDLSLGEHRFVVAGEDKDGVTYVAFAKITVVDIYDVVYGNDLRTESTGYKYLAKGTEGNRHQLLSFAETGITAPENAEFYIWCNYQGSSDYHQAGTTVVIGADTDAGETGVKRAQGQFTPVYTDEDTLSASATYTTADGTVTDASVEGAEVPTGSTITFNLEGDYPVWMQKLDDGTLASVNFDQWNPCTKLNKAGKYTFVGIAGVGSYDYAAEIEINVVGEEVAETVAVSYFVGSDDYFTDDTLYAKDSVITLKSLNDFDLEYELPAGTTLKAWGYSDDNGNERSIQPNVSLALTEEVISENSYGEASDWYLNLSALLACEGMLKVDDLTIKEGETANLEAQASDSIGYVQWFDSDGYDISYDDEPEEEVDLNKSIPDLPKGVHTFVVRGYAYDYGKDGNMLTFEDTFTVTVNEEGAVPEPEEGDIEITINGTTYGHNEAVSGLTAGTDIAVSAKGTGAAESHAISFFLNNVEQTSENGSLTLNLEEGNYMLTVKATSQTATFSLTPDADGNYSASITLNVSPASTGGDDDDDDDDDDDNPATGSGNTILDLHPETEYSDSQSINITGQRKDQEPQEFTVYYVELVWGDMEFAWTLPSSVTRQWNTADHTYTEISNTTQTAHWEMVNDGTIKGSLLDGRGSATGDQATVLLFNHSNAPVVANVEIEDKDIASITSTLTAVTESVVGETTVAEAADATEKSQQKLVYNLPAAIVNETFDADSSSVYDARTTAKVQVTLSEPHDTEALESAPPVATITITLSAPSE